MEVKASVIFNLFTTPLISMFLIVSITSFTHQGPPPSGVDDPINKNRTAMKYLLNARNCTLCTHDDESRDIIIPMLKTLNFQSSGRNSNSYLSGFFNCTL